MKQTYTIRLTPATHTAVKEMALKNGQSISEFIEDDLKKLIVKTQQQFAEPKTRDEIIDHVVNSLPDATDDEPITGAPIYADTAKTEPEEPEAMPYELDESQPTQFY